MGTKYLFIAYNISSRTTTIVGDTCIVVDGKENAATIEDIRGFIKKRAVERTQIEEEYWNDPAILNIQELSEDVAKMLYELD